KSGKATVGANPEARVKAHAKTFDYLSAAFHVPLRLSHEQRLAQHHYAMPPASGFAGIDQYWIVPLSATGQGRYQAYLKLDPPKAFAITERKGWFMVGDDPEAMQRVFELCDKIKVACWLYAVDDRVVWSSSPWNRTGPTALHRP